MDAARLQRAKSILREGNFDIQATRVRKSNDSGVQDDKTSSSKSSSVSSSVSNLSGEESQIVAPPVEHINSRKAQGNMLKVPTIAVEEVAPVNSNAGGSPKKTVSNKVYGDQSAKLRAAAIDNAAQKVGAKQPSGPGTLNQGSSTSGSPANKVTVHSTTTSDKPSSGNTPSSGPPALPPKAAEPASVQRSGSTKSKPDVMTKPVVSKPGSDKIPPPVPPKPANLRNSMDNSGNNGDTKAGATANLGNNSRTALPMSKVNSTVLSNHGGAAQKGPSSDAQTNTPRTQQGISSTNNATQTKKPAVTSARTTNAVTSSTTSKLQTRTEANNCTTTTSVTVVKNTTVIKVMAPGSAQKTAESSPRTSRTSSNNAQKTVPSATTTQKPTPQTVTSATCKATKPGNDTTKPKLTKSKSVEKPTSPPDRPPPPLPPKTGASSNLSSSGEKPLSDSDAPVAPPRRKRSTPTPNSSDGSTGNSPAMPRAAQPTTVTKPSASQPVAVVKPLVQTKPTAVVTVQQSLNVPTKSTGAMKTSSLAMVSKSEMTPVTSTNMSVSQAGDNLGSSGEAVVKVRQIAVKPATSASETTKEPEKTGNSTTLRKGPVDHDGPKIIDPFESLRKEQERQVKSMAGNPRRETETSKSSNLNLKQPSKSTVPRSAVKPRTVGLNVPSANVKKKGGGQIRQTSAGKKRKPKNKVSSGLVQENEDAIVKTRPKSGKKVKKKGKTKNGASFKDKIVLLDKTEMSNRTFISGIGWHIETECDDKSDVHAVVMKFDETDSDEEESPRVVPNYLLDELESNQHSSRATGRKEKKGRGELLPGQAAGSDGSEEEEEEDDDPNAEVIEDEVEFFTNPFPDDGDEDIAHSLTSGLDSNRNHYKSIMAEEMKLRTTDPVQIASSVIPETVQAIFDFTKSVNKEDLDDMLGTKENRPEQPQVPGSKASQPCDTGISSKASGKPSEAKPVNSPHNTVGKVGAVKSGGEPKINNSRKISPRSAKSSDTAQNVKLIASNTSEVKPKKSSPNGAKDAKAGVKKAPSHGPKTQQREEAEINEIIDEILKSTPDPSLSLSWTSKKKKDHSTSAKSMTKEDLAKSLRQSIEHGTTFRELKNTQVEENMAAPDKVHCTLTRSIDSSLPELMLQLQQDDNMDKNSDLEKIANKHRDLKQRVNAAMDGIVSPTGNVSTRQPVLSKPPLAPKTSAPVRLDMEEVKPEKSPRFVRKRHDDSLKGNNHGIRKVGTYLYLPTP